MERPKINAIKREETGKGAAKKVRAKGVLPAILYGGGINLSLNLPAESLKTLRSIHFSEHTIIDMAVEGEKKKNIPVFVKDVQFDPVTEDVLHIDFLKVSLQEKIKVRIPVVLTGEPEGIKEGGTLDQTLREIEIEGLPLNIPEKVEVDISQLTIGHSLHVSDLSIGGGIKIISDPQTAVVTIIAPKEEEEEEAPAEEEAEGEPEVIKEKKEEAPEEKKEEG